MPALITFLCLIAFASGTARADEARFVDPAENLATVFDFIGERLALMPAVAAWKFHNSRPVVDEARERTVLDATVERARAMGIDPDPARALFVLQIELAREIQTKSIDDWRSGRAGPPAARDLDSDLRPALDDIGARLLRSIYLALPDLHRPDFASGTAARTGRVRLLRDRLISPDDADRIVGALAALRSTPVPALSRIRASGVLRVGTTGDYAPFSSDAGGVLAGADIESARHLAKSLGVTAHFIRTTWPTLMPDYRANRFDVAMSGISITPERSAEAAFSGSYHRGGKTPIVRCGREAQLDTLEEIDQPGIRVVVNPGGTNERFARDHIHRAHLTVHPDNRTIFDEILQDRADVMMTDDVEVELQVRKKPGLCRATPSTFTRSEKAVMVVRDAGLTGAVDDWLREEMRSGSMERRFGTALKNSISPNVQL